MDISTLARSVVMALSSLGLQSDQNKVGPHGDLIHLVQHKLNMSGLGTEILRRFWADPSSATNRADMERAVASEAVHDKDFAKALADTLTTLGQPVQGTVSGAVTGAGNVTVGGQISRQSGVIATGNSNVDQSRRSFSLNTGGIVALAIAGLLGVGGTTAVVATSTGGGPAKEIAGTWVPAENPSGDAVIRIKESGSFSLEELSDSNVVRCGGEISRTAYHKYRMEMTSGPRGDCYDNSESLIFIIDLTLSVDGKTLTASFPQDPAEDPFNLVRPK